MTAILQNYDKNVRLKPKQEEIFRLLWEGTEGIIASLPTGYGKSLIFHLCGRLLSQKKKISNGVTMVVAPLNIIQRDQVTSLQKHNISACTLNVQGHFFLGDKVY